MQQATHPLLLLPTISAMVATSVISAVQMAAAMASLTPIHTSLTHCHSQEALGTFNLSSSCTLALMTWQRSLYIRNFKQCLLHHVCYLAYIEKFSGNTHRAKVARLCQSSPTCAT